MLSLAKYFLIFLLIFPSVSFCWIHMPLKLPADKLKVIILKIANWLKKPFTKIILLGYYLKEKTVIVFPFYVREGFGFKRYYIIGYHRKIEKRLGIK